LEGFPLLFRPYLAGVGVAAIVVLSAAVPAVAASPTTTSPVAAPTTTAAPTKDLPKACPFVVKVKDGKREIVKVAAPVKAGNPRITAACRALATGGLGVPKGAPETGGGGMAAEVSSWG
jgi:hypothetical protein